MPVFNYLAKDLQGQYHKGEIETINESQASVLLRRKKLIVISLKPKNEEQAKVLENLVSRIAFDDIVIVTRQLATMLAAGLVLSEALDILQEQQANPRFKKILEDISNDTKGGLDFASSLDKHPGVFPSVYSKLVRAGQASGKLDSILLDLADNLEKERDFRNRVRGAMVYPLVVIFMMMMVMGVMVFFVMPKLMGLYKESNMELPLPTKIMLGLANFLLTFWWLLVLGLIVGAIFFRRFINTPEGKMAFDRYILKLPIIGKIVSLVILTNFTRTLGLLVTSGIPILESIRIVSQTVGNEVFKGMLDIAYKGVERGLTLSSQILSMKVFPKIVGQMIKTGEETGKLDEVMFKLSEYFETEADNSLKNVTTLIEPIVLVILGIGVAFIVISIILPIYQLTTSIK